MTRSIDIEALCAEKGLRITEQRKVIARVLGDSEDHPDVEALHARAAAVDPGISVGLLFCVALHYLWKLFRARPIWPQIFLGYVGACCGLRVSVEGVPLRGKVLVIANHV